MTFYETRFPANISGGATGGPMRVTDVVTLRSGFEERNSIWQHSRRKWDASFGVKTADDLHAVLSFWEAMGGRRHTFRWKDWADYKSVAPGLAIGPQDQTIGTGTGALTSFQLKKTYASGAAYYVRTINKPVADTVRLSVNNVEKTAGVDFTVDTTTGLIALAVAPTLGHLVKAGFEFDVPVRFDNDALSTQLEAYHGGATSIDIIEVRV
jgi:uncharacterized protein (TIGR02217 family)